MEEYDFSSWNYMQDPRFPIRYYKGIMGMVVLRRSDPLGDHYSLPLKSPIADMCFKVNNRGVVVQGRYYIAQEAYLDFDWGHYHTNPGDGMVFPTGTIHVQRFYKDQEGIIRRDGDDARVMNQWELENILPLIHFYNPEAVP